MELVDFGDEEGETRVLEIVRVWIVGWVEGSGGGWGCDEEDGFARSGGGGDGEDGGDDGQQEESGGRRWWCHEREREWMRVCVVGDCNGNVYEEFGGGYNGVNLTKVENIGVGYWILHNVTHGVYSNAIFLPVLRSLFFIYKNLGV